MKKIILLVSLVVLSFHCYSQRISGTTNVLGGSKYTYTYNCGIAAPEYGMSGTIKVTNGSPNTGSIYVGGWQFSDSFKVTWNNVTGTGKITVSPLTAGYTTATLNVNITKQCLNTNVTGSITGSKTYSGCTITMSGATFSNSSTVTATAEKSITISPNTLITQGSKVTLKVTGTSAASANLEDAIADIDFFQDGEEVIDESFYLQEGSVLGQNYPNPFKDNTVIQCYVPYESTNAFLRIIDRYGAIVNTIPLTQKGENEIYLESSELNPGIYMYSLTVDEVVIGTKRMIISW